MHNQNNRYLFLFVFHILRPIYLSIYLWYPISIYMYLGSPPKNKIKKTVTVRQKFTARGPKSLKRIKACNAVHLFTACSFLFLFLLPWFSPLRFISTGCVCFFVTVACSRFEYNNINIFRLQNYWRVAMHRLLSMVDWVWVWVDKFCLESLIHYTVHQPAIKYCITTTTFYLHYRSIPLSICLSVCVPLFSFNSVCLKQNKHYSVLSFSFSFSFSFSLPLSLSRSVHLI